MKVRRSTPPELLRSSGTVPLPLLFWSPLLRGTALGMGEGWDLATGCTGNYLVMEVGGGELGSSAAGGSQNIESLLSYVCIPSHLFSLHPCSFQCVFHKTLHSLHPFIIKLKDVIPVICVSVIRMSNTTVVNITQHFKATMGGPSSSSSPSL